VLIALIHWRIRPDEQNVSDFLDHWRTRNTIDDRSGLIGEFLSDQLPVKDHPYITWHLDAESLGNFRSYVTVGIWRDEPAFEEAVARYFNDERPLLSFEKYRRRRVVFRPVEWRVGGEPLPTVDSEAVL
jgi:hypothetical protein